MAEEKREKSEGAEEPEDPVPPGAAPAPRRKVLWALPFVALGALALAIAVAGTGPTPAPGPDGGPAGLDGGDPDGPGAAGNATLEVQVEDEAGEAISAVELTLRLRPRPPSRGHGLPATQGTEIVRRLVADAAGRGRFEGLPAGQAVVAARAPGHGRGHAGVVLGESPTSADAPVQRLRIVLGPALALGGRVLDEAGAPVSGADVEVSPTAAGQDPASAGAAPGALDADFDPGFRPWWSARTDEAGAFAFDDLVPGPQEITVTAAGFDRIARRVDPRPRRDGGPGMEDVRIILRRTAVIIGQVSRADGAAAPGATVVLAGSGVWPARSSETDARGAFRFTGVPEGIYELRASHGDEVAAPREGLELGPGDEARVDLTLEPGASLVGLVVASGSGEPIVGAEVIVGEDALSFAPRATSTDDHGAFRLGGLRPLPHRVNVLAEGYVATGEAMHTPGEEALRLVLDPAASVSGLVVDALGHPVVGATVEVVGTSDRGAPVAVTESDASFQAAHARALELGPGGVGEGGELGVTLGAVPLIPLTPLGPTALGGPRPSPAGSPAAPAPAAPGGPSGGPVGAPPGAPPSAFVTDESGAFRVGGLPAGRYQVMARHLAHAPGVSEPFAIRAGEDTTEVHVELPRGASVDGRVVDGRGFPVADARVEMHCEREPFPRWALAASDGTFAFIGALDRCVFTAYPAGLPAARVSLLAVGGEVLSVELALDDEVATLSARIVDEAGFPVAGARLTLRSLRPDAPAQRSAMSNDDGTVSVGGLPAPPWRITVDQEGFALETVDLPRRPEPSGARARGRHDDTEEHEISLRPAAAIVGRVVDAWDGAPVPEASVELRRPRGTRLAEERTDQEGFFELSRVPVGNYELIIDADELPQHRQSVRLRPRRPSIEDLDLEDIALAAGGTVTGEVVDALGAPVAGAEVTATTADAAADWDRAVRTDAAGAFTLAALVPGPTNVTARHPGAGTSQSASVRVRPREATPAPTLRLPERLDADRVADGQGATRQRHGVAVRLRERRGTVLIATVLPQTYAEGMGLRAGDVLLSVGWEPVDSVAEGESLLRGPPGTEALVEVRRRGETLLIAVTREAYQD